MDETVAAQGAQLRAAVGASTPWPLDAYITTRIGPLATAADVVYSTTLTVQTPLPVTQAERDNPEMTLLFTGLDLGPGTYYLVLATSASSTINILGWTGDIFPQDPTFTAAPGFSHGTGYGYAEDLDVAFHPSARFIQDDDYAALFWDLTVPAEAPEPGTISLLAAGVALLAIRRWKKTPTHEKGRREFPLAE